MPTPATDHLAHVAHARHRHLHHAPHTHRRALRMLVLATAILIGSAVREAGAQVAPAGGRLYGDGCYYATVANPVIPPGQPGSAQLVRLGCRVLAPNGRTYYVDDRTRIWYDEVTGHQLARNQFGEWFILSSAGWTRLLRGAPDGDGPPPPMPLPPQTAHRPAQTPAQSPAPSKAQQQPTTPPVQPPAAAQTQAVPQTPQQPAQRPAPQPAQQGAARSSTPSPATAAAMAAIQESIWASKIRMFGPKDCVKEWNDFECVQKRIQRDRALHGYNCLSSRDRNTSYCNRKESDAHARAAAEQRRRETEAGNRARANRIAEAQHQAAAAAARQAEAQHQAAAAAARQAEARRQAAAAAARQAEQQRQAREDAARRRPNDR